MHPGFSDRPAYLTSTPYPVFVLASSTDPATPYAGGLRIYHHLSNGYLIVQPGGPHVIFGRGVSCVDDPVSNFLVDGTLPAKRKLTCDYVGVDPYVRIPAAAVNDYSGGLAAASAVDDEINNASDYWNWDGTGKLTFGCLFGGWIQYAPYRDGYRVHLHGCAESQGLALTGPATIDTTAGKFSLSASAPGGTDFDYSRDANGQRTIAGTFLGKSIK